MRGRIRPLSSSSRLLLLAGMDVVGALALGEIGSLGEHAPGEAAGGFLLHHVISMMAGRTCATVVRPADSPFSGNEQHPLQ